MDSQTEDEWLTQDQASALSKGTEVEITWSGGNGPHRYRVHIDRWGRRYAASTDANLTLYNPLEFVGSKPMQTHVRLVGPEPVR